MKKWVQKWVQTIKYFLIKFDTFILKSMKLYQNHNKIVHTFRLL